MANKIYGFGASATNELNDAAYLADAQRLSGNQPGIARSSLVNKALHQISTIAAGVAQFIADRQSADVVDTLTPAQVAALLTANLPNPTVGTSRNLRAIQTTAGTSVTITADEVVVKSALGAAGVMLANFSKTINVATTGAGGMDTGVAPVNGWVAVYAIWNPTTGVSALLGFNATSVTAPEVYGGANMPAGYTQSALVSIWPTNASSQLAVARQLDREFYYFKSVLSTSTTVGFTSLSLATAVPRNAVRWKGNGALSAAAVPASLSFAVCPTVDGQGFPGYVAVQSFSGTAGNIVGGTVPDSPIFTAQTTFYAFSGPVGSSNLTINCYGYTF